MREEAIVRTNERDRELLINALVHPPEPSDVLQRAWEAGMARVQQRSGPVIGLAQRGLSFADEMVKRPFTRPRSEPVQ